MSQCKDPRSCKSQLRLWSMMIFHTVIILQLTDINGGESLANSQYRMLAVVGHTKNITLPCSVNPATDVLNKMVEWSRSDMNPRFVHVRRSGEDRLVDQNPSYKARTSMSVDRLKLGDASLTLTKVRLSDEGTYRCFVPGLNTDFSVELVVEADIKITKVSPGALECKSEGWYPEPKVFWLERERKLLSAGSKETFRGPDDLYTLSSRLTLEKGHSNNLTCRIQQNNQHREATIYVPDDFFAESSSSTISITGGLIAGIMLIIVVSFLVWKWRKNKMENKKCSKDGESQSGREDSRCSSSKNPETETLIKNEGEGKGGREAPMDQGKVEVNRPAYASEQPGLSCEIEHDISNSPAQIKLSESQQNNDQPGRDITNVMCSNEETQSGNTSATGEGPVGGDQQEGHSTESRDATHGLQGQNNDGNGEGIQTATNKTTDSTDMSQNDQAVGGESNKEQDGIEKGIKPQPDTLPPHLEENGTNKVDSSGTEYPDIEETQSRNTSTDDSSVDGDPQQGHSIKSRNAKSGQEVQNNDTNGAKTEATNYETADSPDRNVSLSGDNPPDREEAEKGLNNKDIQPNLEDQNNDGNGKRTETTNNEIADSPDRNISQHNPAEGTEAENGQDNRKEDSMPKSDAQPTDPDENGTNQVPSGGKEEIEGSVSGAQQQGHSTDSRSSE